MQILLDLLIGAVFFVGLQLAFKFGQRKSTSMPPVDVEAKKKAEQIHRHFSQMMSYDVRTALKRNEVK